MSQQMIMKVSLINLNSSHKNRLFCGGKVFLLHIYIHVYIWHSSKMIIIINIRCFRVTPSSVFLFICLRYWALCYSNTEIVFVT